MILKNKKNLQDYINLCFENASKDYKNEFIGATVTRDSELEVQNEMHAAEFHDFRGDPTTWPSLFLNVDDFKKRPYFQNIHFDAIEDGRVSFKKMTIPNNQLFNVEAVISDPNKALNDSMTLRALDKEYDANVLTIDDDTWMLDVYSEAFTIDPCAKRAHGKVLTFGLGIGYFIYMAMLNPKVEHITVVEVNPLIIKLFKQYIQPQFPDHISLEIIEGDAIEWFTEEKLSSFDYVFVDTYQSNEDGYLMMEAMLETYNAPVELVDFWIEDSCIEFIRLLIIIYFDQKLAGLSAHHDDPYYNRILKKIKHFFENSDLIIDSEEALKTIVYDRTVIRSIISINL